MKKISLIIITFNRADDILELLQNISKLNNTNGLLKNVIVVNNASTGDYTKVKTFIDHSPSVPFNYIESPDNLGVARGRNFATQFATGDILVFFDDDILIEDEDILKKIALSFENAQETDRIAGAISYKVLYASNHEMQINAFPHKKFEKYKNKSFFPTYYYAGCAHAITRDAWDKAGTYPPDFFYGMEEYDLSYRILDLGYYIGYNNSVVILHKESPLGRTPKAEQLRMMWVNKCKVAWKYLPAIYFFTTAVMWNVEYILKAGIKPVNLIKAWKAILTIPFKEKRTAVSPDTINYLRKVEARLLY